jgi:hypothetical protein
MVIALTKSRCKVKFGSGIYLARIEQDLEECSVVRNFIASAFMLAYCDFFHTLGIESLRNRPHESGTGLQLQRACILLPC